MFVILDATEFYDAPQADSNSFRVLQEYILRTNSQLNIPEVVLREVVNHAREQLLKIDGEIENAERSSGQSLRTEGIDLVAASTSINKTASPSSKGRTRRTLPRFLHSLPIR